MTSRVTIRRALPADYDTVADVMYDAVHNGHSAYSEAQRQAWVSEPRRGDDWTRRLSSQTIFVAEDSGQIVGFMSLAANGYIDFAYIRPNFQGTGLFRRLYDAVECCAIQAGEQQLCVHASLNAQPAFSAVGFSITGKESVEMGEQTLERFEMERHLGPANTADKTR